MHRDHHFDHRRLLQEHDEKRQCDQRASREDEAKRENIAGNDAHPRAVARDVARAGNFQCAPHDQGEVGNHR
jgi:hypothetical protein